MPDIEKESDFQKNISADQNLEKKGKIKIVCMYCHKVMGEKDGQGVEGVSHSICDNADCRKKAEEDFGLSLS